MARAHVEPIVGANRFLQLQEIVDSPGELIDSWKRDRRSQQPLRSALELRSDFGFVNELIQALEPILVEEGLAASLATGLIELALTRPSFANSLHTEGVLRTVQAAIAERRDDAALPYEVLVCLDLKIQPATNGADGQRHPPTVTSWDLVFEVMDAGETESIGLLMQKYVSWAHELRYFRAERTLHYSLLVLGDLAMLEVKDVPEDWRARVNLLAQAFDASATFELGPNLPSGVPKNLMFVVQFDPWTGAAPKNDRLEDDLKLVKLEARHMGYREVFQSIVSELRSFQPKKESSVFEPRDLRPGEKIYHRKVGNSPGFDQFNEGSTEPCQHQSGYVRYHNSDKAVKGFLRRYTNFEPEWMHHCKKGSCGMYAVFSPES